MHEESSYELVNWEINLKVKLTSKILNLFENEHTVAVCFSKRRLIITDITGPCSHKISGFQGVCNPCSAGPRQPSCPHIPRAGRNLCSSPRSCAARGTYCGFLLSPCRPLLQYFLFSSSERAALLLECVLVH